MILLSKLPAEYQEVEYIESTGTQYIDTGFKPNLDNGFKFDVKYGLTNDLSSRGCILSNYAATNHISFEITNGSYGVRGYFNNGVIDRSVADSNLTINTASFEISNNSYKITQNERTQTGTVTASGISNGYIYMFVDNQKRFNTFTKPLIIYRCKLYDGETLVRDFIPCYRKRDNTIGMYDLIQKKFYTNEGTGTFIKGSDSQLLEVKNITINNKQVKKIEDGNGNTWWESSGGGLPAEYQEVEYIENTGQSYINTGFTLNQNSKVEMVVYSTNFAQGHLFGSRESATSKNYTISDGHLDFGTYTTNRINFATYADNLKTTLTFDKNNLSVVNETYNQSFTLSAVSDFTCIAPAYIFYVSGNPYGNYRVWGKLYSCKIWDNGTLARNLVPCYRKSDTEIGLYDLVNNNFYTNAGSGTFIKGSDV